jgi:NAD(P)-dependent dehydrogenase (short-subunit alcohol dehydrogenase family)
LDLAAAIAYAREGADVAINYFPSEEPDAREVVQLVTEAGRTGISIPGDLRDEAFCQRLVSEAVQRLGGLDIVVCNAATEAAPIRYVAELIGADTDSEEAIRWLIALMVLCCDPLAIALTASTWSSGDRTPSAASTTAPEVRSPPGGRRGSL